MLWGYRPTLGSYRHSFPPYFGIWLLDSNGRTFGYKEPAVMGSGSVAVELYGSQLAQEVGLMPMMTQMQKLGFREFQ